MTTRAASTGRGHAWLRRYPQRHRPHHVGARDCGFVPITESDADRRIVGIVTYRDLCMAAYNRGQTLGQIRIRDAMSTGIPPLLQSGRRRRRSRRDAARGSDPPSARRRRRRLAPRRDFARRHRPRGGARSRLQATGSHCGRDRRDARGDSAAEDHGYLVRRLHRKRRLSGGGGSPHFHGESVAFRRRSGPPAQDLLA